MRISRRSFLESSALLLAGATGGIRFGACSPTRDFDVIEQAGFDYIEPSASEIAEMTAEAFSELRQKVLASRIRCEAFNGLIRRKELVVVGPTVDLAPVLEYLDSTLDRCKQLGAKCIVWGSAGSRNVPSGFPRDKAWDQIAVFLAKAGPIGAKYNLPICIEPLNHAESNILTTAHEAWKMVQQVNHPSIQLMVDYYHVVREHEPLDIFEIARGHILHLHFSLPLEKGRRWPYPGENDPNAPDFFAELKKVRWSGGLSLEGSNVATRDAKPALAYLKQAVAAS